MSKKTMSYVVGIGLFFVVLSFCYYGSYKLTLNQLEKEKSLQENLQEKGSIAGLVETNMMEIDRITEQTRCILETYDLQKQSLEKKETTIKSAFYGFTREEIVMYLEAFIEEMPNTEKEKGLVSYELISFSPKEMVLRKNYDTNQLDYEFFIKAQEGEVVVYFSDKIRIFEYTGIFIDNLLEEERLELEQGFYVKDKEELYGILENYSS